MNNYLQLFKKMFESEQYIFRGVPDSSYELRPSLYRNIKDEENIDELIKIFNKEDDIFQLILKDNEESENELSLSSLCKLQHYGIATRLLDFTKDFDIALAFALTDFYMEEFIDNGKDAAIYVLDKNKFNHDNHDDHEILAELIYNFSKEDCEEMSWKYDNKKREARLPLKPTYFELEDYESFERIEKQKGCFILFPHAFQGNFFIKAEDIECKIIIPNEIKRELYNNLKVKMDSLK